MDKAAGNRAGADARLYHRLARLCQIGVGMRKLSLCVDECCAIRRSLVAQIEADSFISAAPFGIPILTAPRGLR